MIPIRTKIRIPAAYETASRVLCNGFPITKDGKEVGKIDSFLSIKRGINEIEVEIAGLVDETVLEDMKARQYYSVEIKERSLL